MPDADPPRSTADRVRDVIARLAADVDLWVATASADGRPYLVPLSFLWHDERVVMATPERSLTIRNLRRGGQVRLALDGTRDVVLIDGEVAFATAGDIGPAVADATPPTPVGILVPTVAPRGSSSPPRASGPGARRTSWLGER